MSTKFRKNIMHFVLIVSATCCILIETSDPPSIAMMCRFVFFVIALFAICGMLNIEHQNDY